MINDNRLLINNKQKTIDYIEEIKLILTKKGACILVARAKMISRAVDISELLINTYAKGSSYGKIKISTEELNYEDNSRSYGSLIEIEIIPPKINHIIK